MGAAFGGAGGRRRRPAAGTATHGRAQWWARLSVEVGSGSRRWRQARPAAQAACGRYDGWTAGRAGGGAGRRQDWQLTGRCAAERPAATHLPAAPRVPSSLPSLRGWAPLAGSRRGGGMRHLFSAVAGCYGAFEAMHIAVCVRSVSTDHCTQLSGPLVASCYQWVPEYIGDTTAHNE